jgi:cytochrome c
MSRLPFALATAFLLVATLAAQQAPPAPKSGPYAAIPADAAKQPNPVKSSPESLDRAQKSWTMDCSMCHGKDGDGKGSLATDMKLKIAPLTDPNTLKDRTDGELFYLIKNGYQDMPPEGERVKLQENWDLVNYVRSLAKTQSASAQKP